MGSVSSKQEGLTSETEDKKSTQQAQAQHPEVIGMEQSATTFEDPNDRRKNRRQYMENQGNMILPISNDGDVREKYHINAREIGHGHYGVVRKCANRSNMNEWFAIKSIRKSKVNKMEVLRREVQILKEVNHPNIIKLIDVYEDDKYLHLITELCTGGELFDRIISKTQSEEGHFSERDAALLIKDILGAINYCHTVKKIVHRDLKPENFLYQNESEKSPIKIIDFGLSRHDDGVMGIMNTKVGTPYYVAPEVLRKEYTKSCDIWSIGVITYILLCGYPPFYGDDDNQIFSSVRAGQFDFPSPEWDTISQDAKQFICSLLKLDPSKRLTAEEALQHKWILSNSFQGIPRPTSIGGYGRKVSHSNRRSVTFSNYMGMAKLKKAALYHIASKLTKAEIGAMEKIFQEIDTDRNNHLTLSELDTALSKYNYPGKLRQQLIQLREEFNIPGKEQLINWRQFLAATMDQSIMMQEDKIREAFDYFRASKVVGSGGEGCVEMSDLIKIFGGEAQAMEIMGAVDLDRDGRINFEEFKKMMSSTVSGSGDQFPTPMEII